MKDVPPFQPGKLTLEQMQLLRTLANKVNKLVSGNIQVDQQEHNIGLTLPKIPRARFVIRLDSKGTGADAGKYAWTAVSASDSAPFWEILDASGTIADDPALELNLNDGIDLTSPVYVPAWREPGTDEVRFQLGSCS